MGFPGISVIIPTYNSERTIGQCVRSIFEQYYRGHIKIFIIDDGSTDRTIDIIAESGISVHIIGGDRRGPEKAKVKGIKAATGEILCMMASDNILCHKDYFTRMVAPFILDPNIHASYSRWYKYDKNLNAMSRYFSVLGGNDPVAWYLKKNDKQGWQHPIKSRGYEVQTWNENDSPTLGDNGFFIRREVMLKSDMDNFYHIDNQLDLIRQGYDTFAVVNNSIIHDTGERFFPYLKKRFRHTNNLYFKEKSKRRYHVVKRCDGLLLFSFILYTILGGAWYWSIKNYIKQRDISVFLHGPVCLGVCIAYGICVFNKLLKGKR